MLGRIELTDEEQALLNQITLDSAALRGHEHWQANGDAVCALMQSLVARNAVPEARRKYFTDPDYNPGGRGRSHQQEFEKNGCTGDEILRHASFLKFLKYFLQGPDLPKEVKERFREAVIGCGNLTSGDVVPLGKLARQLVRDNQLNSSQASEEFYKLALDCGIWFSYAEHIRSSVKQMR
jgi:hypothetical protein